MNRLFSLFLSVVVICGTGARSTALAQDLAATSQKVDQLLKAGNFAAAEPYTRTMLALVTKAEGRNSDAAANASHTLAYVLMNENKNADAEPFARQALETWQKVT